MLKNQPQIMAQIKKAKKGRLHSITYKHIIINGNSVCEKETTIVGRFCDYDKMKVNANKQPSNKTITNTIVVLKDKVYYNTNTKNFLVSFKPSQSNHCATSKYKVNGNIVDSNTYYQASGKKPSAPTIVMSIKVQDIVSIK